MTHLLKRCVGSGTRPVLVLRRPVASSPTFGQSCCSGARVSGMSKPGLRIGSLFSGIGGWEIGIEAAFRQANIPCRTVWQGEMDDYCRDTVLARHWPNAKRYRDVKEVGAHNLDAADIICGGWPCQDISYAGRGAGLEGERSGLFFEAVRIIREMEPRLIFMENVPALYTRGFDAVLWHLQSLGYDLRWGSLRASAMGAPHRRERWFCVGWKKYYC